MLWPCETRTSTCRSFATISSGLYRFLAIAVLLDVKDIPQVGPLQWGWIRTSEAYGSDAVTPAAWVLARTTRIKVCHPAHRWWRAGTVSFTASHSCVPAS